MYFVLFCLDKPSSADLRAGIRPLHLEYIEAHMDMIVFAGPLLADDSETAIGSLIVIDCPDIAAAKAFAKDDPYALGGLFETVEIRRWRKVLPAAA